MPAELSETLFQQLGALGRKAVVLVDLEPGLDGLCAFLVFSTGENLGESDELTFFIPVGTFNDATDLRISAFIQTFPLDADPITEDVGDGAPILMGSTERDPC